MSYRGSQESHKGKGRKKWGEKGKAKLRGWVRRVQRLLERYGHGKAPAWEFPMALSGLSWRGRCVWGGGRERKQPWVCVVVWFCWKKERKRKKKEKRKERKINGKKKGRRRGKKGTREKGKKKEKRKKGEKRERKKQRKGKNERSKERKKKEIMGKKKARIGKKGKERKEKERKRKRVRKRKKERKRKEGKKKERKKKKQLLVMTVMTFEAGGQKARGSLDNAHTL